MANEKIIPKRPSNDSEFTAIKANDRDCLSYSIVFNVPNERAYALFHPEFLDESGKLTKVGKKQSQQFFSYARHKEYADAYRRTLAEFLERKDAGIGDELEELTEERKEKASKLLMLEVIKMIEAGKISDPEFAKLVTDLAIKMKITKEDVERIIPPVRFLPERCFSSCRYRLFVENAVKGGSVIDECQYCKALAFANENGYKDDSTKRLDIPKEVLDAEPENTVKTVDILSGKCPN